MRIVIDLQGAQTESRYRGIGRYSVSLARAIAGNRGSHDIWLALNGAFPDTVVDVRRDFRDLLPAGRIQVFRPPVPAAARFPGNQWRTRAAELLREYFLARLQPDMVLVTSMVEGHLDDAVTSVGSFIPGEKTAAVLYDLIPSLYPEEYLREDCYRHYYLRKIEFLRQSGLLLAISESTRKEALASPELAGNRIVNISSAVDSRFKPLSFSKDQKQDFLARNGISRKMILYVPGGFDHRKNFGRLFEAFTALPEKIRREYQLVIAGNADDKDLAYLDMLQAKTSLEKTELVLTGYLTDDDLVAMYNSAELCVCPSLHEGFGLPVLEAMACGTPVIGSRVSSIPEIIGREDALFDPGSPEAITACLAGFLQDDRARKSLAEHGLEQAGKFSWDASARSALRACEDFLSRQKAASAGHAGSAHSRLGRAGSGCLPPDRKTLLHKIAQINGLPCEEEPLQELSRSIAAADSSETAPKQILVDVSSICVEDIKTGIQRVVRAQLLELLCSPPPGFKAEPVYLSHDGRQWRYRYARSFTASLLGIPNLNLPGEPADMNRGDILYMPDHAPLLLLQAAPEGLYQELKERGVFISTLVHDLLPVFRPEFFTDLVDEYHSEWLAAAARLSDQVICPSAAVASELKSWLELHNPQGLKDLAIEYLHHGADIEASVPTGGLPEGSRDLLEKMASTPTFLMVGTIEPRKGCLQALSAFDLLRGEGEDVNLVIIGRESWAHLPDSRRRTVPEIVKRIRAHPELDRKLFWIHNASDELLREAYDSSSCLLAASEGEGFGLPLIEASRHGLPVMARDIPVFREVAGEHAFYFTGLEAKDLAGAMREWLGLFRRGGHPSSRGIPWMTWRENVEQLKRLLIQDSAWHEHLAHD